MTQNHKTLSTVSIMVLVIVIVSTCCIFATDSGISLKEYTTQYVLISEYETIKQLSEEPTSNLERAGYSPEEIARIRNYKQVFSSHILMLQDLSNQVLYKHGYDDNQIDVIRNFSGSDEQMSIASASLYIYATPSLFTWPGTGSRTTGCLAYGWSWTGIPAFKFEDIVAAQWNSWGVTDNDSYVSYYDKVTGECYTSGTATFTYPTDYFWNGGGHKFDVGIVDNAYYAKLGGGYFSLQSDVFSQKDFYYHIEYGHTVINTTVSFSVGVPPSISGSIVFSFGTNTEGVCSGSYIWP